MSTCWFIAIDQKTWMNFATFKTTHHRNTTSSWWWHWAAGDKNIYSNTMRSLLCTEITMLISIAQSHNINVQVVAKFAFFPFKPHTTHIHSHSFCELSSGHIQDEHNTLLTRYTQCTNQRSQNSPTLNLSNSRIKTASIHVCRVQASRAALYCSTPSNLSKTKTVWCVQTCTRHGVVLYLLYLYSIRCWLPRHIPETH